MFSVLHAIMTRLPAYANGDADVFDIISMVRHMRRSRRYMVQTIDQFKFCFDAAIKIVEQYIDAVRATGRLNPPSTPGLAHPPTPQLLPAVLAKQLKESLRREFDANRARAELQRDLLELTTGVRDTVIAADLREDLALSRQRVMQMSQRHKEQELRMEKMLREMDTKTAQVKQLATIVGQLEMDLADRDDEIAALRRKIEGLEASSSRRDVLPPTAPEADYLAVGGADEEDERGYIVMDPGDSSNDDAGREGDAPSVDDVDLDDDGDVPRFEVGAKPVVVLGAGDGDDGVDSDSEL